MSSKEVASRITKYPFKLFLKPGFILLPSKLIKHIYYICMTKLTTYNDHARLTIVLDLRLQI